MNTKEAIEVAVNWLSYLDKQRIKSFKLRELATLAKLEPEEAKRQMRKLESNPVVYDASMLEVAVTHLLVLANKSLVNVEKI